MQMEKSVFVIAASGDPVSGEMKGNMVPDASIWVVVVVGT